MTKKSYSVQVEKNHYTHDSGYLSPARWSTNARVIEEILKLKPKKISKLDLDLVLLPLL